MNDQTLQLLTALAAKIGTTTEYIWMVLVKQGPISGLIDLLIYTMWLLCIYVPFKFIKGKTTKKEIESKYGEKVFEAECGFLDGMVMWGLWGVCALTIICIIGFCFSSSVSAILNPEYYALKEITSLIKLK